VEKHGGPRWQAPGPPDARHGKEVGRAFNGLLHAARAMAKEACLVEPSLVIATTIQLPGAVDERSYRAPRHWPGKN
jgi:hypothetical protein